MDARAATAILKEHLDPGLTVRAVRPLRGGMVNHVLEFLTDGDPPPVVAKISDDAGHSGFRWEYDALRWHREHSGLPVPWPYACFDAHNGSPLKGLLLEKVRGRNLADARLTERGMAHFQADLARLVADLHEHTRPTYGSALVAGRSTRWLDEFAPAIGSEFRAVRDRLSPRSRRTVARLLERLDAWLPEFGRPTLVHGDLWATNIMVDDADPDRPAVTAFLDGGATYREVESELAYLRVFGTADATFFEQYGARHAIRPGFDRRCRVYWLCTMMLHVRVFGNEYLPACERLAEEIGALE